MYVKKAGKTSEGLGEGTAMDRRTMIKYSLMSSVAAGAALAGPSVFGRIRTPAGSCMGNPVIGNVGLAGLQLSVSGTDLGAQLGDVCLTVVDDLGNIAAVRPTSVSGTAVTGVIDFVPPGMTSGRVMLAQGVGTDAAPGDVPAGFQADEDFFSWYNDGQPVTISSQSVSLVAAERQLEVTMPTTHVGVFDPVANVVEIDITDSGPTCTPNSTIKLVTDMRLSNGQVIRFDMQGALKAVATLPLAACITAYCNFLAANILSQTGGRLALACAGVTVGGRILLQLFGVTDLNDNTFHSFVNGTVWMRIKKP